METQLIMDQRAKRNMGILCVLPAIAFVVAMVYYFWMAAPVVGHEGLKDHSVVMSFMAGNYGTLFTLCAIFAVISSVVLIYCIVHLARQKHVNAAEKLLWIVELCVLPPVSFILFWYFHVRLEPTKMDIYPDIA